MKTKDRAGGESKRQTRDERLMAAAEQFDARAAKAEAEGRQRWAQRYRERAAACRADLSENDQSRFAMFSAKVSECELEATRADAAGNKTMADHFRQCSQEFRRQACRFDRAAALEEFDSPCAAVSVGISQEIVDALDVMQIPLRKRSSLLGRILAEAVFALQDEQPDALMGGSLSRLRFNCAKGERVKCRWAERSERHVAGALEIEYQLAKAQFAPVQPISS